MVNMVLSQLYESIMRTYYFILSILIEWKCIGRYKGRREFYRYTPKENPAMKTFNVNGINVMVSRKFLAVPYS